MPPFRGDTSTVESKAPAEQDYEGSTDEENTENNENPRPSTSARGKMKRLCLSQGKLWPDISVQGWTTTVPNQN